MVETLVVSSVSVSVAAAAVLVPWVASHTASPDEIAKKIDVRLQRRLGRLAATLKLTDARAYAEIADAGGYRHLLNQMRLMAKWGIQKRKLYPYYDREVAEMEAALSAALRLARFSVRRLIRPETHSAALTQLFAEMAGLWESIAIDSAAGHTV